MTNIVKASSTTTYRFEIAPGYEHLESFILALPERFQQQGDILHDARNYLKVMDAAGEPVVVKSFQQLGLLRRLIYTFLRAPKAARSFKYARRLQSLGINTADPIGYLQCYRHGVLADSYFIARQVDADYTIGKIIHYYERLNRGELETGEEALEGPKMEAMLLRCADFTADMHRKGVLHLDYSKGNLLIREQADSTELVVIDVNRMAFGPVSAQQGAENLVRLMKVPSAQEIFIRRYAQSMQFDEEASLARVRKAVARHERFRRLRHRLKERLGLRRA